MQAYTLYCFRCFSNFKYLGLCVHWYSQFPSHSIHTDSMSKMQFRALGNVLPTSRNRVVCIILREGRRLLPIDPTPYQYAATLSSTASFRLRLRKGEDEVQKCATWLALNDLHQATLIRCVYYIKLSNLQTIDLLTCCGRQPYAMNPLNSKLKL